MGDRVLSRNNSEFQNVGLECYSLCVLMSVKKSIKRGYLIKQQLHQLVALTRNHSRNVFTKAYSS